MKARGVAAAGVLGVLLVALTAGEARGEPGWSWPVEGSVVTAYSNDDANAYAGGVHRGIDIAAAAGTPVRAARAGEVTYAGALGYSGLTVSIRTVDGYLTSYLHLSAVAVRRGETVGGGAQLGAVGTTGRRSKPEPHLHFGVRIAGEDRHYLDPLTLLPPLPGSSPAVPATPAPATVPAVPRPAPVRAISAPARVRPARRPEPRRAHIPVHLPLPAPVPRPAPVVAHWPRARPVPVAPARAPAPVPAPRHVHHGRTVHQPAPAPAPRAQAPARDWGRPLALAGIGLLVLALFGQSAVRGAGRANRALSARAYEAIARAVRPARAYLPRWR
jgi:hypothetical protein